MDLINNNYFRLYTSEDKVYFRVISNTDINYNFTEFLRKNPRVIITKFLELKKALKSGSNQDMEVGYLKPEVEINISSDNMFATYKINLSIDEFELRREELFKKIKELLDKNNISHGIKEDFSAQSIVPNFETVIAEATYPQDGRDAQVKYIEIPKPIPTIKEDGSTDYYHMNLIQEVEKGDWLGHMILATSGIPGKNVLGEEISSKKGKDKILRYNTKTIAAIREANIVTLRAKIPGVVRFISGKLTIEDHLMIKGDVGYETGNIDFNGFVTIKGTVDDGFSVVADKDISILGEYGVGAAQKIHSREGNIYIKGGVNGKDKVIIEAGKSIFVKYVNACTLKCAQTVNIGFYAIDSDITAQNIIVSAKKGKVIGGSLNAESKISLYTIGNLSEKMTRVNIQGFDRDEIKEELERVLSYYKKSLVQLEKNRSKMAIYEKKGLSDDELYNIEEYRFFVEENENLLKQISELEERRVIFMDMLKSRGEGEVSIQNIAYPKTMIKIKKEQKVIKTNTSGKFYFENNRMNFE